MLQLKPTTYTALGGILLALVVAIEQSGLVPAQYAGVVSTVSTALALLMGKAQAPAPAPSASPWHEGGQ